MQEIINKAILTATVLLSASCATAFAAETEADATLTRGAFAWGAEVGPSIDMGGDDMSTMNLHACFGYRNKWLKFAGIGAGIDVMLSNSSRSFPIYALVRSSFSTKPKLLFGDLRVGVAYNQTSGIPDRTNFYISPGLGIELARGKSFSSHLVLSYSYNAMTFEGNQEDTLVHGLNRVNIGIGVSF